MLRVLCTQQRCSGTGPYSSCRAIQKPSDPSPMASFGAADRPRRLSCPSSSRQVLFSKFAVQVRTEFIRRLAENDVSFRHTESFENALSKLEGRMVEFASRIVSEISVKDVRD